MRLLLMTCLCSFFALTACGEDLDNQNTGPIYIAPTSDAGVDGEEDPDADPEPDTGPDPDADPDPAPLREPPVPGIDPSWVGGHSVENRAILVEYYGESGPILFILSGIHGTERLAISYGERFRTELNAGFAERHGIQVVYMQATNPDGAAIYQRYNINGIDLNRNFPTDNFEPGGPGGDMPESEPETVAIKEAVDASNFSAVLSLHCCAPIFDHDGPGEELAQAMSDSMDPAYSFPEGKLGASLGSLGSYVGVDMNMPIITVEFARAEYMDPLIQLAQMDYALDAAGFWTFDSAGADTVDFETLPTEEDWSYRSWSTGDSASGISLRAESMGELGSERFILLSGFSGEHRLGAWIGEHIRRELLGVPYLETALWEMITAVNPDGLANGTTLNADNIDIKATIAEFDHSVAEADHVLELIGDSPATIFLVENSDDNIDRVSIIGPGADELIDHIAPRFSASADPEDMELAEALAAAGHRVVQIVVGTENAEAQVIGSNDLDPTLNSPADFSEMVFSMSY